MTGHILSTCAILWEHFHVTYRIVHFMPYLYEWYLINFNAATTAALNMILDVMNTDLVIINFICLFVIRLFLSFWLESQSAVAVDSEIFAKMHLHEHVWCAWLILFMKDDRKCRKWNAERIHFPVAGRKWAVKFSNDWAIVWKLHADVLAKDIREINQAI